jgi:hypothetical protein
MPVVWNCPDSGDPELSHGTGAKVGAGPRRVTQSSPSRGDRPEGGAGPVGENQGGPVSDTPEFLAYVKACDYPGTLDVVAVERHLAEYLAALSVTRRIKQLRAGWSLDSEPDLAVYVRSVLGRMRAALDALAAQAALAARDARDALAARDARDARAALDARDARDAQAALDALDARDAQAALDARDARDAQAGIHRFACWCIQSAGWWWYRWECSWLATTWFGAQQLKLDAVAAWSRPLLDAFVSGAWLLHWTEHTLYWVAKPTVHTEVANGRPRLHCVTGPALDSDVEPLYFWHGLLVPDHVVMFPGRITAEEIQGERNVEVRRILLERFGPARYIEAIGARCIQADDYGALYEATFADGLNYKMVRVTNGTLEPDGTVKEYWLGVPVECTSAHDAVARTYQRTPATYRPLLRT